jgi:hypothetical protein
MVKEKQSEFKSNTDNCCELFEDLYNAFMHSKVFTEAKDNKHFAFDMMCGISIFTSAVLRALGKSYKHEDVIFNFYTKELLPDAYEKSEEIFEDGSVPTISFEELIAS